MPNSGVSIPAPTKRNFARIVRLYEQQVDKAMTFRELREIVAKLEGLRQAGAMLEVATDALNECTLIKGKALIKMYDERDKLARAQGAAQRRTPPGTASAPTTAELGLTRKQVERWSLVKSFGVQRMRQLMKEEPERFSLSEVRRRAKALIFREKVDAQATALRAAQPPLPDDKFYVIEADPPWPYGTEYDPATRRVANPYPEMTVEQIAAMPIAERAQDDAVLWLWIPNRFLLEAAHIPICRGWGFEPKNILTWAKDRMGTGRWMRGQTEHCILAIRGRPTTLFYDQPTLVNAPMGAHSAKPDAFYDMVERTCPAPAYLKLFARSNRANWISWGDEAPTAQSQATGEENAEPGGLGAEA